MDSDDETQNQNPNPNPNLDAQSISANDLAANDLAANDLAANKKPHYKRKTSQIEQMPSADLPSVDLPPLDLSPVKLLKKTHSKNPNTLFKNSSGKRNIDFNNRTRKTPREKEELRNRKKPIDIIFPSVVGSSEAKDVESSSNPSKKINIQPIRETAAQSASEVQQEQDDCNEELRKCQERTQRLRYDNIELHKNLDACSKEVSRLRQGLDTRSAADLGRQDLGEGAAGRGPIPDRIQGLRPDQFIKYPVFYNPVRNEFYTQETGVVDMEYARDYIDKIQEDYLTRKGDVYSQAFQKMQPIEAERARAYAEEDASVEYNFVEEFNRHVDKLNRIKPDFPSDPIFSDLSRQLNSLPLEQLEHIDEDMLNSEDILNKLKDIIDFDLPEDFTEKNLRKKISSNSFEQNLQDYTEEIRKSKNEKLQKLYKRVLEKKRPRSIQMEDEAGPNPQGPQDPGTDLEPFIDPKDLDYLTERSEFISEFRSNIQKSLSVSCKTVDTSEYFIDDMSFTMLDDEYSQSLIYEIRNSLRMPISLSLDDISSERDQVIIINYIICKVISEQESDLDAISGASAAILAGTNFQDIILQLPPNICEEIGETITSLFLNPQNYGVVINDALVLLQRQINSENILGQGQGEEVRPPISSASAQLVDANATIIKLMNTFLDEREQIPEGDNLELDTGNKEDIIKEKLRLIPLQNIDEIERQIMVLRNNGPSVIIENFLELVMEMKKEKTSKTSKKIKYGQSIAQQGYNYDLNSSQLGYSSADMGSDSEDELGGGAKNIIQKGGIPFPFSSVYFELPPTRPAPVDQFYDNCLDRYYEAGVNANKKDNADDLFQYDLILIILQILLYADSMHDFKGDLNQISKNVLVGNIFDAFNGLYNTINKPGVNDYFKIRKCIEFLKPEVADMLNNFKSKASEEWGGYESVIAYRYTQDIGLSEVTILKYIYINPNDLDDPHNFFDKETLIQLGNEGFIFCSSTTTPGDTKVDIGGVLYNFFILMNIDGSRVTPVEMDENVIKRTMRVYEDNPISKDILAYLFGITANKGEVRDTLINGLSYIKISLDEENQMTDLLNDIANNSIPGNSDPSNRAVSIAYSTLRNARTIYQLPVDNEQLQVGARHPNELLIKSMQTFLDVYADSLPANRIVITRLTVLNSQQDPSKYIGIQIETTPQNQNRPYKLLLTSTSIEEIKTIVSKLFNNITIQYGLQLDMSDPAINALNATLNPLQREIMNLAIMYYNNMSAKFKTGSNENRKNIFMSCVLMWKAFGDYWEITYVYGLDYLDKDSNKYLITSTDKNVALMKMWLGVYGIIAKTSIHLPEAYDPVSIAKDTADEISLDVDEENFIKKQMGEGMIINVLPKNKDKFLNIKKLKADLMAINDRWSIISEVEAVVEVEMGAAADVDAVAAAPASQVDQDTVETIIENIREIKEKNKPIENRSSIDAITSLLSRDNLRAAIREKLIPYVVETLSKMITDKNMNNTKIAQTKFDLGEVKKFDEICFGVLNDNFSRDNVIKILERRRQSNTPILKEYQAKIDTNTVELNQKYTELAKINGKKLVDLTKQDENNKKKIEYDISRLEKNTKSNQTKMNDILEKNAIIVKITGKLDKTLSTDDKTTIKMITRKEMKDNNLLKKQTMFINLNAVQINLTNEIERLSAVLNAIRREIDINAVIDANAHANAPAINALIATAAPPLGTDPPIPDEVVQMTQKVIDILILAYVSDASTNGILDAFDAIRTLCDIIQLQRNLGDLGQIQPFATVIVLIRYFTTAVASPAPNADTDPELDKILGNSYQETKKVSFVLDFHDKVLKKLPNKTITDIEKLSSNFKDDYYRKMSKEILSEGYDDSYQVTQDKPLMLELNHQLFLNKCDLLKAEYSWAEQNFEGLDVRGLHIIEPLKEFNEMLVNAGLQCVSLLEDLQQTIDYNKDITTGKARTELDITQSLNSIVRGKDKFLTDFKDSNKINNGEMIDLLDQIRSFVNRQDLGRNKPFKVPLLNVYSELRKPKYGLPIAISAQALKEVWFTETIDFFTQQFQADPGSLPPFDILNGLYYFLSNFSIAKKADTVEVQDKITRLFSALGEINIGANISALNNKVYQAFTELVAVDDFDLQNLFSTEEATGVSKKKLLKQILDFKNDADNKKELQRQKEAAEAEKVLEKQKREEARVEKEIKKQKEAQKKGILNKIGKAIKTTATAVVNKISEVIKPDKPEKPEKPAQNYDLLNKAQQSSLKELSGPILKALVPFQKRSSNAIANYFATSSEKTASNLTKYREFFVQKMDNCLKDIMLSAPISPASLVRAASPGFGSSDRAANTGSFFPDPRRGGGTRKYTRKQKNNKPKKKRYTHSTKIKIKNHLTKKYKNKQKAKKKRNSKRK